MRSAIMDDVLIGDRSDIVIELMILKSNIPGFFVDVTKIMLSSNLDSARLSSVASRIHQLRIDLLKWNNDYEALLSHVSRISKGSAEYDRRCKVFATYLSCIIISSRLLGALSSSERVELEDDTRNYAGQMQDLELEVKSSTSAAALFMAQTLGVAQATLATSKDWLQGEPIAKLESVSPEGFISVSPEREVKRDSTGLIHFWKFAKWNKHCGRKIF